MNRERIAELRAEDEAERLSMGELLEIQSACDAAGISITEDNDPLTAADQLDELEARLDDCPPQGIERPYGPPVGLPAGGFTVADLSGTEPETPRFFWALIDEAGGVVCRYKSELEAASDLLAVYL